ncbi:uncharacterized protein LOC135204402 [Macrobrachium nipponense]|uniref:uncharacterized protein LOC135204402 n=1 Tax=Macrobrachium nipponense TaxID=159736 RepID=UPI0030C84606
MDADNCSNALILYEAAIREIERRLYEIKRVEQLSTAVIKLRLGSLQKAADSLQTAASEYYKEIKGRELVNAITRTNAVIHDRQDMNDVIKFTMLTSYLKGKARETVEGLAITPANYSPAINLLKTRFSNVGKLEENLRNRLLSLPHPEHDAEQLMDFLMKWNSIVHQLDALPGITSGDSNEKAIIKRCLSKETLQALYQRYDTCELSVDQLRKGIEKLIERLGRSNMHNPTPSPSNPVKSGKDRNTSSKNERQANSPSSACNTNVRNTPKKITFSCCFCQGEHSGKVCMKYNTLETRRARINELQLCYGCLRKGHRLFECNSKSKAYCFICNGKHHTFLCARLLPNSTSINVNLSQQPSSTKSGHSRADNKPIETAQSQPSFRTSQKSAATNNQSHSQNNVNSNQITVKNVASLRPTALPTATLLLSNDGNRIPVRASLDSGSQRTFINPDVVEKLNLVPIKQVKLTLIPFGDNVETKMFDVVRVMVRAGTKRIKLNAVVCNHVNTSIHTPGLHNVYLRLQEGGVKLADKNIESDTHSDIGLIIGADYYNAFVYCHDKYDDVCLLGSTAGAVIFGPIPNWACNVISDDENVRSVISTQSIVCSRVTASVNPLDGEDISRLWSLDTIGIGKDARSYNDQAAIEHFNETIVKTDNKYTIDLPFKSDARPPTCYRKALGQLYSLKRTFHSKPVMFDQYQSVLDEYVKLGLLRR